MIELCTLVRPVAALACFCWAFSEAASATSIGLNFATDGTSTDFDIAITGLTGVVPQQNWNNAHNSDATLANLVDDQGTATGASVTWNHAPLSTNVPSGTPAGNLMHSAIGCSPADGIVVSNIRYASFDLYLYMADTVNRLAIFKINHGQTAAEQLSVVGKVDTSGSTSFVLSTSTIAGNYLVLTGVTGSTLYIGGGGFQPVDGLQIVETPEPSSIVLTAFGFAGLIVTGWRRKVVRLP